MIPCRGPSFSDGGGGTGGRLEGWYVKFCRGITGANMFCCCCCWYCSSLFHPHFSFNSLCRNPVRHPVSFWILSKISSTSSCSRRETRHSAAMARDLMATLATPLHQVSNLRLLEGSGSLYLSLTCATMPHRSCACDCCNSCISGVLVDMTGWVWANKHIPV